MEDRCAVQHKIIALLLITILTLPFIIASPESDLLIACYPLNSTYGGEDIVNGYNLTLVDADWGNFDSGEEGFYIDGIGDTYAYVADIDDQFDNRKNISYVWKMNIIDNYNDNSYSSARILHISDVWNIYASHQWNDDIRTMVYTGGANSEDSTNNLLDYGNDHTWEITWEVDNMTYFRDGVQDVQEINTDSGTIMRDLSNPLYIGIDEDLTSYAMKGTIGDLKIIGARLNSTQLTYFNNHTCVEIMTPDTTCTCAGLNNNWEINHADNCFIQDNCDLGTGTLSFTGSGNTSINATITTSNVGAIGNGNTVWMYPSANIQITT